MSLPLHRKLEPIGPHNIGNSPSDFTRTVREYFLRHPGVVVWFTEIHDYMVANGFKDYPDLDNRIRNSINNTRQNRSMVIDFVVRGQSWIYRPNSDKPIEELRDELVKTSPISAVKTMPQNLREVTEANTGIKVVSERLYREKMVTRSGDRVLEDEDGVLFRARELDLE